MNRKRIQLLYEYLLSNTCEGHFVTISQMINYCKENGIDVNRNTIYKDIKFFEEIGIDIICVRNVQNRYYIGQRQFEIPELKMLLDAVDSAQFITGQKTKQLKEKLLNTVSVFERERISRQVVFTNKTKKENNKILYEIDCIIEAIEKKGKISFYYFKYNDFGEEEKQNNGERYIVYPYVLKWSDDRYYLIAYSDKDNDMRTYRVDRIREAKRCGDDDISSKKIVFEKGTTFNMYSGETVMVELMCKAGSLDKIIDRFGLDYEIMERGNDYYITKVEVMISPPFYGWIFTLSNYITIIKPQSVVDEYRKMVEENIKVLK